MTYNYRSGEPAADERRSGDDRRACDDRRSGLDRRGTGRRSPLSRQPRAYAFRELDERRDPQDRRVYGDDAAWNRRKDHSSSSWTGENGASCGDVCLTAEEIRALLDDVDG